MTPHGWKWGEGQRRIVRDNRRKRGGGTAMAAPCIVFSLIASASANTTQIENKTLVEYEYTYNMRVQIERFDDRAPHESYYQQGNIEVEFQGIEPGSLRIISTVPGGSRPAVSCTAEVQSDKTIGQHVMTKNKPYEMQHTGICTTTIRVQTRGGTPRIRMRGLLTTYINGQNDSAVGYHAVQVWPSVYGGSQNPGTNWLTEAYADFVQKATFGWTSWATMTQGKEVGVVPGAALVVDYAPTIELSPSKHRARALTFGGTGQIDAVWTSNNRNTSLRFLNAYNEAWAAGVSRTVKAGDVFDVEHSNWAVVGFGKWQEDVTITWEIR